MSYLLPDETPADAYRSIMGGSGVNWGERLTLGAASLQVGKTWGCNPDYVTLSYGGAWEDASPHMEEFRDWAVQRGVTIKEDPAPPNLLLPCHGWWTRDVLDARDKGYRMRHACDERATLAKYQEVGTRCPRREKLEAVHATMSAGGWPTDEWSTGLFGLSPDEDVRREFLA